MRIDLGDPELIHDGVPGGPPAIGGSLPLWWDEQGLYARQRSGLVRCDPTRGGCVTVYYCSPSAHTPPFVAETRLHTERNGMNSVLLSVVHAFPRISVAALPGDQISCH